MRSVEAKLSAGFITSLEFPVDFSLESQQPGEKRDAEAEQKEAGGERRVVESFGLKVASSSPVGQRSEEAGGVLVQIANVDRHGRF